MKEKIKETVQIHNSYVLKPNQSVGANGERGYQISWIE